MSWYETRLKATTVDDGVRGDEEEALLDSGASHAFRPPISKDELLSSRKVGVSLATGEERSIPQTQGETLLGESERGFHDPTNGSTGDPAGLQSDLDAQ